MPILYVHDKGEFDIDDLPLERWVAIQKTTGRKWRECVGVHLFEDVEIAMAVLDECAAETGSTLKPRLTLADLFTVFKVTPADNRPSEFNEGIPDPKAEDSEPATT
jgi:hypothetical protein